MDLNEITLVLIPVNICLFFFGLSVILYDERIAKHFKRRTLNNAQWIIEIMYLISLMLTVALGLHMGVKLEKMLTFDGLGIVYGLLLVFWMMHLPYAYRQRVQVIKQLPDQPPKKAKNS